MEVVYGMVPPIDHAVFCMHVPTWLLAASKHKSSCSPLQSEHACECKRHTVVRSHKAMSHDATS
jgi:hypothetical protein